MTYKISTADGVSLLTRAKKDGDDIEVVRVVDTPDGRLLVTKSDNLRFTDDNGVVKLKQAHGALVAVVSGVVAIFKKPHAATFHREYMKSNRRAQYLGIEPLSDAQVIDNMLEFIARI